MKIPKLTHLDLIAPSEMRSVYREIVCGYNHPRLLRPDQIPIHPTIPKKDFPYTQTFCEEVMGLVPDMVQEHASILEDKLKTKLNLKATKEIISDTTKKTLRTRLYENIKYYHGSKTGIRCGSANMWNSKTIEPFFPHKDHPLPLDKAKAYAVSDEDGLIKLHGWKIHNIRYQGLAFEMIAINYALAFNNLALDKINLILA